MRGQRGGPSVISLRLRTLFVGPERALVAEPRTVQRRRATRLLSLLELPLELLLPHRHLHANRDVLLSTLTGAIPSRDDGPADDAEGADQVDPVHSLSPSLVLVELLAKVRDPRLERAGLR